MNEKERRILRELRNDARQPLAGIAKKLGVSEALVGRCFREAGHYCLKHTALIDLEKLGHFYRMNFAVKARDRKFMLKLLEDSAQVNNLYALKGEFDFYAECIFENISKAHEFHEKLQDASEKVQKNEVTDDLKREAFSDF